MARLKIYSGITSVEITPNKIPSPASAELLRIVMKNFDLIWGKDQTFNLIRHRYALACNLAFNIHYVIPRDLHWRINEEPDKFYARIRCSKR